MGVIEIPTIDDVNDDCPTCTEYIEQMSPMYKDRWMGEKKFYNLKKDVVEQLKELKDEFTFVVLFADWCGDARRAVPVLSKIEEELGIKIRALGGMTKPPFGSSKHWAVPPSPPEVDTFSVTSSPTILIFDKEGKEIGRIKTRPKLTPTIEEEILKIIKDHMAGR